MMRSFKLAGVALIATAALAGCSWVPNAAPTTWSSPTAVLAIRHEVEGAMLYQRTVLGSDEVAVAMSRRALEQVAGHYRNVAASAIAHARGAADLQTYALNLDGARQRDPGFTSRRPVSAATVYELTGAVAEYQGAFRQVANDIDARLGRVRREREPRRSAD
jgi:hypothetical protein